MSFVLTRSQLYGLVWSEPMQRLSKQIGISDVAIAKHCRKVGVPVPERGYWNKLQAGKRVVKTVLPERDLVTVNRIEMSGTLPPELQQRISGEPGKDTEEDSLELRTERLRERLGSVTVPRHFSRAHPAIAALLKKDEQRRQQATTSTYAHLFHPPQFESPFERRRLSFLNGLFLGFDKVGARPWVRGTNARGHAIYMGNLSVHFTLEKVTHIRNGRGRSSAAAAAPDRLYLSVCERGTSPPGIKVRWEDEENNPLEKRLSEVIIGMALAAEHLHRQSIERHEAWERERRKQEELELQRRKAEVERRERERLAAIEKAKLDSLIRDAENWRQANTIRHYVAARISALSASADLGELESWRSWALVEADKLDPTMDRISMDADSQSDA